MIFTRQPSASTIVYLVVGRPQKIHSKFTYMVFFSWLTTWIHSKQLRSERAGTLKTGDMVLICSHLASHNSTIISFFLLWPLYQNRIGNSSRRRAYKGLNISREESSRTVLGAAYHSSVLAYKGSIVYGIICPELSMLLSFSFKENHPQSIMIVFFAVSGVDHVNSYP